MYEAITGNFSALAKLIVTDGSTLMIAGRFKYSSFFCDRIDPGFSRGQDRKKEMNFKSFTARSDPMDNSTAGRFFERHHIPALKKCPNCAEQLQLSALICDACDYNFLSGMVGRGQKLLPSPEPMTHEMSDQSFASAGGDEITDKSEACRSIEYFVRLDHTSPHVRVGSTTRSLPEKTCRRAAARR